MIALGERIRRARQARGYSQGDLETRTGLLRCYLSRVENGHTEPSLQTLARLAAALEMPVAGFFEVGEDEGAAAAAATGGAPILPESERSFLAEMRSCAASLSAAERQQVLALAQKMAAAGAKAGPRAKA